MKRLSRPFIGLLLAFFSMGYTDPYTEAEHEVYAEQERIKKYILLTQKANKQPNPSGGIRAMRKSTNRYKSDPVYPRVIYPEYLKTGKYSRFYGGIPR